MGRLLHFLAARWGYPHARPTSRRALRGAYGPLLKEHHLGALAERK
ncbi:hypothetical protein ACH4TV_39145 [Streptomyces sp. NPDC020898]